MASTQQGESIAGSTTKRSGGSNGGDDEKRQKLSLGMSKPNTGKSFKGGIQIKINPPKATQSKPLVRNTSVFNDESDEEPVEMPPEARMRMRNIGRDTPTSAGPNSYGKTKHGFCTVKRQFDRNLEETNETFSGDPKNLKTSRHT